MSEILSAVTSLPNLHPAVVHFPIALLPLAVVFDLLLLALARQRGWLERAATFLYVAAGVGAGAAFWTGRQAVDSLPALAPSIELHVNRHSDSGLYTLWLVAVLAIARAALLWWDPDAARRLPRIGILLLALVAVGMVFRTADLGGALVYQHGVGVAARVAPGNPPPDAPGATVVPTQEPEEKQGDGPAASRFVVAEDGIVDWTPSPTDGDALGSVLLPVPGSSLEGVRWVAAPDTGDGLHLEVTSEALLVLPGSFGDVQVEARLDLSDFDGEAGLLHHVGGASQAGFFTVSSRDQYVLGRLVGDGVTQLGASTRETPPGPVRLTVSAIGRHLKGLVGDETVVHGHEPALLDGSVGLLFRGRGSVRILSVKVVPVGT